MFTALGVYSLQSRCAMGFEAPIWVGVSGGGPQLPRSLEATSIDSIISGWNRYAIGLIWTYDALRDIPAQGELPPHPHCAP